ATDTCDPVAGCRHTGKSNGDSCSDGNVCNGAETCQGGLCVPGTPAADGTDCSDGNACNGDETCHAGVCLAGTPVDCGADVCDPAFGCVHDVPIAGTKLSMRAGRGLLKTKAVTKETIDVSQPPSNRTGSDPVMNGGTLRLVGAGPNGTDVSFPLPAQNCAYIGPAGA